MVTQVFEEISPADFFYRNRDIAGFTNPSRAIFELLLSKNMAIAFVIKEEIAFTLRTD